ncbi:inositol polyphosphate phosphatase-like 1b isoform X2 [Electrophorus electricus]|uniref:inositol polyphosphate phosphatase-like 1b isoform X2 n=1 Tax=Electrophorus electricus TaxID=8005 RepID=UPI0015CFA585|nr:inositol polyphosphate phosphatase-like 1b isoform X2 [Electrophorus electricus]
MTTAAWYHRDISRVRAEELLAHAGRNGSFLVRDSESVPGAYALCLLFQRHVHTYRILPDTDGLLALQTTQGVQVNCFRTIGDLILRYQQPHKGLVSPLLYPVGREMEPADESSDGDDEKPGSALNPVPSAAAPPAGHSPPASQTAAQFLLRRLQEINTPSVASEMVALLGEYLHGDVTLDLENLRTGGSGLHFLQRILATACHRLHSEIDQTMFSLETLAKVFDHPSCPLTASKIQNMGRSPEDNLDTLLHKITALSNLLSSLENRVLKALQDAVANHNLSAQPSPVANHNLSAQPSPMANHNLSAQPSPVANHNLSAQPSRGANHNLSAQLLPAAELSSPVRPRAKAVPVHSFQVKVFRYGRQTVSVDVNAGVLLFDRKTGPFSIETITHDRILQLVKFSGSPTKLRMVVDSHQNQPHEVLFESVKKREAFCQLLQLMKTIHAQQGEPDLVSVFVGTWNMGGSPPPRSLQSWVTCSGLGLTPDESTASLPHDIYAFGTQDNPQGEKEWTENIRGTLRTSTQLDFKQVALQSLWNIRLAVFVKPEHERRISQIHTASLKRGLGNTLGNKGAVGISFLFNSTAMGFVNCHLTSGSEKALRRNQNFQDILRLLSLGDRQIGAFDLSMRFTHLFWCGDLNYRLDLDVQDILKHVSKREFNELMCADQLTRERHKRKAFFTFNEGKITFPPTYRYERGSRDSYLWQKYKSSGVRVNGPSWCDRVLWKSYPETYITCTSYGCTDDIFTSDHSPVFATFHVGVTAQLPRADSSVASDRAWIELETVEAIVKTASKARFFIEFHSRCLEEPRRSTENDWQSCEVPGFLKLGWGAKQFPKLHPLVSDMEYLLDQHLLLSVKSCDGFESYGECCVALRSLITSHSDSFETCLTHRGEGMGSIRGCVKVHIPPTRRRTRERTYEFCIEKDDQGSVTGPWSPPPTHVPRSQVLSVSCTAAPSSYTNPAYFIFEGVPILRKVEEDPLPVEPSVVWAKDSVIQLPKVTGGNSHDRRAVHRSDFTEIEIPGSLPPYVAPCESSAPQITSSYQLFPGPDLPNPSGNHKNSSSNVSFQSQIQRDSVARESELPDTKLGKLCMDHSVFGRDVQRPHKETVKKDHPRAHHERLLPRHNGPKRHPCLPTRVSLHQASVPWVVEQPPAALGDHSLTALQIAKSLSEVDFPPTSKKHSPSHRPLQPKGYDYALRSAASYCWEKECVQVSVLHGAPETVRELLKSLGLQCYAQALSLNGWDDLDYFSGITDEDLQSSGVMNPSHRRRILENLPKIWD